MIPHEKQMVAKLKDQPFALLGVNSDGGRSALLKIMQKQGITWRQAVDGDTSGPLAAQWKVTGWPTIYILDARGVIRYKDVQDPQLEDAVAKLINEAKSASAK